MKSNPPNILQIFASRIWGGGEQYVYDLSKRLLEDNYHVYFIQRKSAPITKQLETLQLSSQVLPLANCFDGWSIIKMAHLIKKFDIELIHVHQFKDAFIAIFSRLISRRNIKIVLTRHLVKKAKVNRLYSFLYKQINKIIFVSDLAKNEFLTAAPPISLNKIITIHNSIYPTLSITEDIDLRTRYNINKQTVILAFTGRLVKEKGIEVLIEAVKSLKELDFILLIAGKGEESYEQFLKDKVKEYDLDNKILFSGFIENVHSFIKQIDIGIAPSVWREPFGLSIIEMMQAGKPVITTNNGAQTEYITDKWDGVLVPPSDEQALSKAIHTLLTNKKERLMIGLNAQNTFNQKLSYAVFYKKILDVYSNS